MKSRKRILIAGIGNRGDGSDRGKCEITENLAKRRWPAGVTVRDFTLRGFDLVCTLAEPFECVVLIDAGRAAGRGGVLSIVQSDLAEADSTPSEMYSVWDVHSTDPSKIIRLARSLGTVAKNILLVRCEHNPYEPASDDPTRPYKGDQAEVQDAADLVESIVGRLLSGEPFEPGDFYSPMPEGVQFEQLVSEGPNPPTSTIQTAPRADMYYYYLYGVKPPSQRHLVATFNTEEQLLAYVRWATLQQKGEKLKFEQGSVLAPYDRFDYEAKNSNEGPAMDVVHNPSPSML